MKIISVKYDYWVRSVVVFVCILVPWHNTISLPYFLRTVGTIGEDAFGGTNLKDLIFGG